MIVVACVATITSSFACLSALPAPLACTDEAPYRYCQPVAVTPGAPSGGGCSLATSACLVAERGGCTCEAAGECLRTAEDCHPPPDCPPEIRDAVPGARCLGTRASFGPSPNACTCGCASCASACDGRGPIFGARQTLRVTLEDMPSTGKLGVYVRARGIGAFGTIIVGATPTPIAPIPAGGAAGNFRDLFPAGVSTPAHAWSAGQAPRAVDLAVQDPAELEIDCVVPFLVP